MKQKEKEIKLLYNTGYTNSDMIYFGYGPPKSDTASIAH
jgi:hypothetical protein